MLTEPLGLRTFRYSLRERYIHILVIESMQIPDMMASSGLGHSQTIVQARPAVLDERLLKPAAAGYRVRQEDTHRVRVFVLIPLLGFLLSLLLL